MGEVLLGVLDGAEGISTPVVVKRIRPEFSGETAFRTMFRDEAKALAHVRHPNVVQVFEFGVERNELFLVMEYIEGESASTLLRTLRKAGQPLPLSVAVHIVAEAAAGLHAAHEQSDSKGEPLNLIHRDVSPQNILVTYGGMAKLVDFGIAKTEQQDTLTRTGELKGKYGYMAPEQFMEKTLDRRVDVFALGVVLFELTTGRRLFKRASAHAAMRAICDEPLPEPTLPGGGPAPEWLRRTLERALSRDVEARYPTAQAFRRDLLLGLREVDPEGRVEEELPALMRHHFGDRQGQKRELIHAVQEGVVTNVRAAQDYMAPTPSGASLSVVQPPQAAPATTSRAALVAAVLLAAAFSGGVAVYALRDEVHEPVAEAPATRAPAVPPSVEAPEAPSPIAVEDPQPQAEIHVVSDPAGAEVYVDDALQGTTPVTFSVPPGPVALRLEHAGFRPLQETVEADGTLRLRYQLRRQRSMRAGRAPRMHAPAMNVAPTMERSFGRFD